MSSPSTDEVPSAQFDPEFKKLFSKKHELLLAKLLSISGSLDEWSVIEWRQTLPDQNTLSEFCREREPGEVDIHLIRHGQTNFHVADKSGQSSWEVTDSQGNTVLYDRNNTDSWNQFFRDATLTKEGESEARGVGTRVPLDIDHVVMSKMTRTWQTGTTALPIVETTYNDEIQSTGTWSFDNRPTKVQWSKTHTADEVGRFFWNHNSQVDAFSKEIKDLYDQDKRSILVFSHGGFMGHFNHRLMNDYHDYKLNTLEDPETKGFYPVRPVERPNNAEIWSYRLRPKEQGSPGTATQSSGA